MNLSSQLAKQFREAFLDGDWISTNYKAQISDVDWEQATTKIGSLNTIAALTFHVNYYVAGVLNVLEGGTLDIRDKYSFDMPPIESQEDWEKLRNELLSNAKRFAELMETITDEKYGEPFVDEKYGNYLRNMHGMIEHAYYHLGQIVLLKKLISEK
jgi:hypothetical protein